MKEKLQYKTKNSRKSEYVVTCSELVKEWGGESGRERERGRKGENHFLSLSAQAT